MIKAQPPEVPIQHTLHPPYPMLERDCLILRVFLNGRTQQSIAPGVGLSLSRVSQIVGTMIRRVGSLAMHVSPMEYRLHREYSRHPMHNVEYWLKALGGYEAAYGFTTLNRVVPAKIESGKPSREDSPEARRQKLLLRLGWTRRMLAGESYKAIAAADQTTYSTVHCGVMAILWPITKQAGFARVTSWWMAHRQGKVIPYLDQLEQDNSTPLTA